MKTRLIVGTINHWPDDDEWRNLHMDASGRGIWHHEFSLAVLPEFVGDAAKGIPMKDATVDEVRMHHVLEHLTWDDGAATCAEAFRVLKVGGVFDVEVPDLDRVCRAWLDGGEKNGPGSLQQWIYGEQLPNHETWDSHRYGYTEDSLRDQLAAAGFHIPAREETGLAVRFVATKPGPETDA